MWLILVLFACTAPDDSGDPLSHADLPFSYPADGTLRMNHSQAVGTHNSYHVQTSALEAWEYTHLPLNEQLSDQGVRQFELDVSWDDTIGAFRVEHAPVIDAGTTCATLVECLTVMKVWSDHNPAHHPFMTLIETKYSWSEEHGEARLAAMQAEVLSVWPMERLITPDSLRGDSASIADALDSSGWPTLGEVRGKGLFVLHDNGGWRDALVTDLDGQPLVPDAKGAADEPWSAVHSMNDPYDSDIQVLIERGHMVRTRCDTDTEQARTNDTTRRDQALASGAHWVSTDFPGEVDWTSYFVQIPGGTPLRCNPLVAPAGCESLELEDPAFIE